MTKNSKEKKSNEEKIASFIAYGNYCKSRAAEETTCSLGAQIGSAGDQRFTATLVRHPAAESSVEFRTTFRMDTAS
jgi:hypothetical protein